MMSTLSRQKRQTLRRRNLPRAPPPPPPPPRPPRSPPPKRPPPRSSSFPKSRSRSRSKFLDIIFLFQTLRPIFRSGDSRSALLKRVHHSQARSSRSLKNSRPREVLRRETNAQAMPRCHLRRRPPRRRVRQQLRLLRRLHHRYRHAPRPSQDASPPCAHGAL
jgi:hypothetical protein